MCLLLKLLYRHWRISNQKHFTLSSVSCCKYRVILFQHSISHSCTNGDICHSLFINISLNNREAVSGAAHHHKFFQPRTPTKTRSRPLLNRDDSAFWILRLTAFIYPNINRCWINGNGFQQRFWYNQLAFSARNQCIKRSLIVYEAVNIFLHTKGWTEG